MIQSGLIQTDARLNNVTGVLVELPSLISWITRKKTLILPFMGHRHPNSGRYTTQKHTASTQYSARS